MKNHRNMLGAAMFLAAAGTAHAEMPVFSAECPQENYIDADRTGAVRVNGEVARVEMFNEHYYEARQDGITYTISTEDDGSGLLVGYNPPGSAGGYCTVVSSASGEMNADDGGGAMAGASGGEPTTGTERVRFQAGTSGAELTGALAPGASMRYVLGASNGQDLYVRVDHVSGPRLDYQIFNPDGTFLLDMIPTDKEYRGQLWQSGDHVIEVINRGGKTGEYRVIFGIE